MKRYQHIMLTIKDFGNTKIIIHYLYIIIKEKFHVRWQLCLRIIIIDGDFKASFYFGNHGDIIFNKSDQDQDDQLLF